MECCPSLQVLEDELDGLAWPPLDLEYLSTDQSMDPAANFFDDFEVDDQTQETLMIKKELEDLPQPKKIFGKGKELKTVLLVLKPSPNHGQDWSDEEKMECSKRKLHEAYEEDRNKRRKIQILDVKDLPAMPPKPQKRILNKNKVFGSRKCRAC